jgi:transcriptional regulator with XRE-family HTH domain
MAEPLISSIDQYVIDTVRKMRQDKNMSQKDLADELDLSIGFIGDVENPNYRAKYNLAHINQLAKIFNCSPQEFLPKKPL